MLGKNFSEVDFSLSFPEGRWTNHSTQAAYDFRYCEQEQIMVVRHVARKPLSQFALRGSVIELFRARLNSAQELSSNSCKFDSPACTELLDRFDASVFGQDLRHHVFMQFGFFGRAKRIIVVSYYDYSGSASPDTFKTRATELLSSVKVVD